MKPDLKEFLSTHSPLTTESAAWGRLPLAVSYYLTRKMPPPDYVTSVRAIVFNQESVLVVRDGDDTYHVVPGGRRQDNETIEETLRREVLEETGWTIVQPVYFGFVHFRYLAPLPENHKYPYPDFLQLLYVAQADTFVPETKIVDEYVVESGFLPLPEVWQLKMDQSQKLLLQAALRVIGM